MQSAEVLLIVFTLYLSLKGFPFALKGFNNLPNITLRNEKMIAMAAAMILPHIVILRNE